MLITIPEFQRFQHVFTAHIRNPKVNKRPNGIEARRMRIYNELVYNNIESALLICFPVLKKMLGRRLWARLLRAFIAKHRCYAPFFRQIGVMKKNDLTTFFQSNKVEPYRSHDY